MALRKRFVGNNPAKLSPLVENSNTRWEGLHHVVFHMYLNAHAIRELANQILFKISEKW